MKKNLLLLSKSPSNIYPCETEKVLGVLDNKSMYEL